MASSKKKKVLEDITVIHVDKAPETIAPDATSIPEVAVEQIPYNLDHYEVARRKHKVVTLMYQEGKHKFPMKFGNEHQELDWVNNSGDSVWDSRIFKILQIEYRPKLTRLRWLDVGSESGCFAFHVAANFSPKVVMTWEANANKFSYLRYNHMSNDKCGIIATAFGTVVQSREPGNHIGNLPMSNTTGSLHVNGTNVAVCPIQTYSKLSKSYRFNAVRLNMGGLEKPILVEEDLSKLELLIIHMDESLYTEAELKDLGKKLFKSFKNVLTNHDRTIIFCHNFKNKAPEAKGE